MCEERSQICMADLLFQINEISYFDMGANLREWTIFNRCKSLLLAHLVYVWANKFRFV